MNDLKNFLKRLMLRFYFIASLLISFSFLLIGKLVYIQFYENNQGLDIKPDNLVKNVVLEPSRGDIFSAEGNILATSIPRFDLYWDATMPSKHLFNTQKNDLADSISVFKNLPSEIILNKLEKARKQKQRYLLIEKGLSFSEYKKFKSFPIFSQSIYRGGLIVEQDIKRENPLGKLAERTIGYEIKDKNGSFFRVGLEGAFSEFLRGNPGMRLKQKIANGQWKPISDSNEKEPTEGYDLHTTLNIKFQDIVHNALLFQLEKFKAEYGTAILMDVKSGAIKAISNLGKTEEGKYFEKLNYAVGETNEPGSTFKLMSMIAALEDNVINEKSMIETGDGELTFFNKYKVKDSKKGGYGLITAAKAFEVSSNVGLVKIVYDNYKNNPEKFVNRLYNMGLNKTLNLPILGEGIPKIPHPTDSDWDGLDLPWMAYGYGVSLTPLQILAFYNAIANDGQLVKPRFLSKISNKGNLPAKIFDKQILNPSICSKETLEKVKQMMINVVDKEWGTANKIKDPLLKMAGKTGTCQVDYIKNEVQYISSFVGYFPAEKPKYSCIVVIHRPEKSIGYYGATVAAPVFKIIAKKIYNNIPIEIKISSESVSNLDKIDKTLKIKNIVPDVSGFSHKDAIKILKKIGLSVEVKGNGKVKSQSIKPGTKIEINQKILIELA